MLSLSDQTQVYLARDPVDMRKQIDGLVLIVQEAFDLDPFAPAQQRGQVCTYSINLFTHTLSSIVKYFNCVTVCDTVHMI
jgi:hypothetical protein